MKSLYDAWIDHVFNRPETSNGWYFDLEINPHKVESDPASMVDLIIQTCQRSGTDLSRFTLMQVKFGLNYIFNGACSNVAHCVKDSSVPVAKRIGCIESIWFLYRDCYFVRCAQALGHLDEAPSNPLNASCYMLWDDTALGYWEGDPSKGQMYVAITKLLERVLGLDHQACAESALHGLGHLHHLAPN